MDAFKLEEKRREEKRREEKSHNYILSPSQGGAMRCVKAAHSSAFCVLNALTKCAGGQMGLPSIRQNSRAVYIHQTDFKTHKPFSAGAANAKVRKERLARF